MRWNANPIPFLFQFAPFNGALNRGLGHAKNRGPAYPPKQPVRL